jgi:hypothetical protein
MLQAFRIVYLFQGNLGARDVVQVVEHLSTKNKAGVQTPILPINKKVN